MWNRMYQLFFIFTNSMDGGKKEQTKTIRTDNSQTAARNM